MNDGPQLIAEGPFFAQLWESVLFDPELNPSAIVVYAVLQRYAGEAGSDAIFPQIKEIADRIGMHRDTVADSLQLLAKQKHITRHRDQHGRWIVTIKAPKPMRKNSMSVRKISMSVRKISMSNMEKNNIDEPTPIKREIESNTEGERADFAADAAAPKKRCRKVPLPEKWDEDQLFQGPKGLYAWAEQSLHMPPERVDHETDKFMDHWHSSGEGKCDWLAAWRLWMRRAMEPKGYR